MDRLMYFLLGLVIGAFVEPTLAILCRDLAKLILYKKLQREFNMAIAAGRAEAAFMSQHTDNIGLTASPQDKARLN